MSEKVLGFKEKEIKIRKRIAERRCVICGADISDRHYSALKCFSKECEKVTIEAFSKKEPVVSLEWLGNEFDKCMSLVDYELGKEFEDEIISLDILGGRLKDYLLAAAKKASR